MIYSKDDVKRILDEFKSLPKFDVDMEETSGGCGDPECCGSLNYDMIEYQGSKYIKTTDLEAKIASIKEKL